MNEEMIQEYEAMKANFLFNGGRPQEEFLGGMNLAKDERVIKGELMGENLFYTITDRQIMVVDCIGGTDFSFEYFDTTKEDERIIDACPADEGELIVLVKNTKLRTFFIEIFNIRGKITMNSKFTVDPKLGNFKQVHYFQGNIVLLDVSLEQLYKFQRSNFLSKPPVTGTIAGAREISGATDQKEKGDPSPKKPLRFSSSRQTLFIQQNKFVKFKGNWFMHVANNTLKLLDLNGSMKAKSIVAFKSDSPIADILEVSPSRVMLVSTSLRIFIVDLNTKECKTRAGPGGFSIEGQHKIVGGLKQKILFINKSNNHIFSYNYKQGDFGMELIGEADETLTLLDCNTSKRFYISFSVEKRQLELNSFAYDLDKTKAQDIQVEFGIKPHNIAFLEQLNLIVFAGSSLKLQAYDLEKNKHIVYYVDLETLPRAIFSAGFSSFVFVATDYSVKLYAPEHTMRLISTQYTVEDHSKGPLEIIPCVEAGRFGIYHNSSILIFDKGDLVFKTEASFRKPTIYSLHPIDFSIIYWDQGKLALWEMDYESEPEILNANCPPKSVLLLPEIYIIVNQTNVVFLNGLDRKVLNIFSVPNREDNLRCKIRVIPLMEQHTLAVYLTNELYLIDRGTFKIKEWWPMSSFNITRNIFPGVENPKEFYLLSQNVFGYSAKWIKYTNVLTPRFMIKPTGKNCQFVAQSNDFDAIYVGKKNQIKLVDTNSWSFIKKYRNLKPIKQMDFAVFKDPDGTQPLFLLLQTNRFQRVYVEREIKVPKKEFFNQELENANTEISCFCTGKEGLFMCTSNKIMKGILDSIETPGKNLVIVKEEILSLSKTNVIQEIKYYSKGLNGQGSLLILSKEGFFFEASESLKYRKTYQPLNPNPFMECEYLMSSTGRFGVKIESKNAEVFELSTGKTIYKNVKHFYETNDVLKSVTTIRNKLHFTFDQNDEIMAFTGAPNCGIVVISIKNADEFKDTSRNVIEEIDAKIPNLSYFRFVKPGYTLILGNDDCFKRVIFGKEKKVTKIIMQREQKISFPRTVAPGTPQFSWYISCKGEVRHFNHESNKFSKVGSLPIYGMISSICATKDNKYLGLLTLSGMAQILDTTTCTPTFTYQPKTVEEDIKISTVSASQDMIYFQYRTGSICCLDMRKMSTYTIIQEHPVTYISMVCGQNDKVLYLMTASGDICKLDLSNLAAPILDEKPFVSVEIDLKPKHNLHSMAYINKDNSLIVSGKKRIIFWDIDYNRFERSYQAQDKVVFSEVWVSDDDRFAGIYILEPTPKIVMLRVANLGKVWEYDIPSSLIFRELAFTQKSKFMQIVFKGQVHRVNFDTFDDTYSDLVISGKTESFTYQKAFGFNLHLDISSLSAKCLTCKEGQELNLIKIFEELLRDKGSMNQSGKLGMFDQFVQGPNWGCDDLKIWNHFLIDSSSDEIQELINMAIYERAITNPYAVDPMRDLLEKMDENELVFFFGEEFFEVYFANFTIKITNKKKDLIILDNQKMKNSIEKSSVCTIEEGFEEQIVGDIKNRTTTKTFGNVYRTSLDVFDQEFDNPKFIHLLMLLNKMPISVFKNESVAQLTDYYWKKYKVPGMAYFFFYTVFLFFLCLHVYVGGESGLQLFDYFFLVYLYTIIVLFFLWEAINIRFQGITYFKHSKEYIITFILFAMIVVYTIILQMYGEVNSNFSGIVIFWSVVKGFSTMQYLDSIRQFSTRMINIFYDIKIFLVLMALSSFAFGMIFYVLSVGENSALDVEKEVFTAFDFYFSNWDINTDFIPKLIFQLLLMVMYGVIAFNILIALANNSWEESGKQGEAFDRKMVMSLIISNWNVIKWLSSFFHKKKSLERIYLFMYAKPERVVSVDKQQMDIAKLKKGLLRIMSSHMELQQQFQISKKEKN